MDTNAAVRRLEASGLTREQAEAVTAVMQEAVAPVPTTLELRNFVLEHDVKLERFRGEVLQEFGRVNTTLARIEAQLAALRERL